MSTGGDQRYRFGPLERTGLIGSLRPTQVIIIADTITLYPQEIYDNGMRLITASTIRNHPQALSPRIKSLNYLNNILAKIDAANRTEAAAFAVRHGLLKP